VAHHPFADDDVIAVLCPIYSSLSYALRMRGPSISDDSGDVRLGLADRTKDESYRLGASFRLLVGVDREAANCAFAEFLAGNTLNTNQIELIN
jgi:hypothetical protein